MSDPRCWGPSSEPSESIFIISFLYCIEGVKVQNWCKYMFNRCFDGGVYFGGGILVWVLTLVWVKMWLDSKVLREYFAV